MAVFVEGIGGTGKAVINLLKFAQGVAEQIGESSPDFACGVTDQDPKGAWPGVVIQSAANGLGGPFKTAYQITDLLQECAARLLFSDAELQTEIGRGFHGYPKLAAALSRQNAIPNDAGQHSTHVLVYSDIGGTGAGLGPAHLAQLLDDPNKTYVITIVFGKYLSTGIQNPIGYEWLSKQQLRQNQNQRWFFGYYVNVPPLQVGSSTPPSSGLNSTPALPLAAAYIWQLVQAERGGGIGQFLQLAGLATQRNRVVPVNYSTQEFTHATQEKAPNLISLLRQCGKDNRLNPLIPTPKQFLGHRLRQYLQNGLASECWKVFQAPQPQGSPAELRINWTGCFNDTFRAVPDPWAAAEWFHKAVEEGDPKCTLAFFKLLWLFLQGRLHVFPTNWGPRGEPEVYALTTEPLQKDNPQFASAFAKTVVGGFSREFPFWTVPAFINNLPSLEPPPEIQQITIRLKEDGKCGRVYQALAGPINAEKAPCSVRFEPVPSVRSLAPNQWDWTVYLDPTNWNGLERSLSKWALLQKNVELYQGTWTLPRVDQGQEAYTCDIRGVHIQKFLLKEDGIFAGAQQGIQYYELQIGRDTKRVLTLSADDRSGQPVADTNPVSVLYGNVLMTIK